MFARPRTCRSATRGCLFCNTLLGVLVEGVMKDFSTLLDSFVWPSRVIAPAGGSLGCTLGPLTSGV